MRKMAEPDTWRNWRMQAFRQWDRNNGGEEEAMEVKAGDNFEEPANKRARMNVATRDNKMGSSLRGGGGGGERA